MRCACLLLCVQIRLLLCHEQEHISSHVFSSWNSAPDLLWNEHECARSSRYFRYFVHSLCSTFEKPEFKRFLVCLVWARECFSLFLFLLHFPPLNSTHNTHAMPCRCCCWIVGDLFRRTFHIQYKEMSINFSGLFFVRGSVLLCTISLLFLFQSQVYRSVHTA